MDRTKRDGLKLPGKCNNENMVSCDIAVTIVRDASPRMPSTSFRRARACA